MMCISIKEVTEIVKSELENNNEIRNINLAAQIKPLSKSIKDLGNWKKTVVGFFIANLLVVGGGIYYIGGWMADVTSGINRNAEHITEVKAIDLDMPSALVLNEKIEQCKTDQTKTETQLQQINAKLDRLIERGL